MTPTEDAVTPFPNPETTPPETTTYFISLSLCVCVFKAAQKYAGALKKAVQKY